MTNLQARRTHSLTVYSHRSRQLTGQFLYRSSTRLRRLAAWVHGPLSLVVPEWPEAAYDDHYGRADDAIDRLIGRCFDLAHALDEAIVQQAEDAGIMLDKRRAAVMRVSAAVGILRDQTSDLMEAIEEVEELASYATGLHGADDES